MASEGLVPVNAVNFVRAETDHYFDNLLAQTGGLNRWQHYREPASIDEQAVIRLNRDTLYSPAVVDIQGGATLTLPEASGRYQTAMIVNQDHYINRVFDRPGTYELGVAEFDTPYVAVAVRTLVDASDADDVAAVNTLQDKLVIEAASAEPFTHPRWDEASLGDTRRHLLELARGLPDTRQAFGSRSQTEPIRHLLGTAAAWGGLPEDQAFYLNLEPRLPVGHYTLTVGEVPVRAFWSISVYNADGYFERNEVGRYSINSIGAVPNDDGTVTVHFGGDPSLPNQIPIMDGWNYAVRLYQPEPELLDGSWTFPSLEPTA